MTAASVIVSFILEPATGMARMREKREIPPRDQRKNTENGMNMGKKEDETKISFLFFLEIFFFSRL